MIMKRKTTNLILTTFAVAVLMFNVSVSNVSAQSGCPDTALVPCDGSTLSMLLGCDNGSAPDTPVMPENSPKEEETIHNCDFCIDYPMWCMGLQLF